MYQPQPATTDVRGWKHFYDLVSVPPTPTTAEVLLNKTYQKTPLSSGIRNLDILLGGQLYPGELIELYGKSNSGKTQLVHKIVAAVVSQDNTAAALYIDLHNDFSPSRIRQFVQGYPTSGIYDRVGVIKAFGVDDLLRALSFVGAQLARAPPSPSLFQNLRLLVIDALPFVIFPVAPGHQSREAQERVVELVRRLGTIHNLTVVIVNHSVNVNPETSGIEKPANVKPALGHYGGHIPNTLINLTKIRDSTGTSLELRASTSDVFRATLEKSGRGQTQRYFDFMIADDDII